MSHSPTNNAITRRLVKMQELYTQFYASKEGKICMWNIKEDEIRMVDVFFETETTEAGVFNEFFLDLRSPFTESDLYHINLFQEFVTKISNSEKELKEAGVKLRKDSLTKVKNLKDLFSLLDKFREAIHPNDGRLIIFLSPAQISDVQHFENWLLNCLHCKMPKHIRLMITATDNNSFQAIKQLHKKAVISLTPKLDMPAAIEELAKAGNSKDPGVKMRKLVTAMNLAATKGNIPKAETLGNKAIQYAKSQPNMEHMVPAVHSILGAFMLTKEDQKHKALQYFKSATNQAKQAIKSGNPLGRTMLYQASFSQGAALIGMENYKEAAECYEDSAITAGEDEQTVFQQMEAYRMAGICYYNQNNGRKCWDCNWKALGLAAQLDEQSLSYAPVASIGQVLLAYAKSAGRVDSEIEVEKKMVSILGKSWKDKLQKETSARL